MDTPVAQSRTNVVRSMVRAETLYNTVIFLTIEALGWCGDSDAHCLPANACNAGFGQCTGTVTTTSTPPVSTPLPTNVSQDGRCGVGGGGTVCSTGQCCSESGWCGLTSDYCISPGCQLDFGLCDAEYVSSDPSSIRKES